MNNYSIHFRLGVFNGFIQTSVLSLMKSSVTEHKCEVSMSAQELQDEKSHSNLNSILLVHKHDKFSHSVIS